MNQRDIAKLAGVSSATVSRVVNNDPWVAKETYERVMEVIRENGYVPNAVARSLRVANTRAIGYLMPEIRNPVFPEVLGGFQEMLFQRGYDLIFNNTDEDEEKERKAIEALIRYRVDGLLVVPVNAQNIVKQLENFKIPIVFLDKRPGDSQEYDSLTIDNRGGMMQLVEHLAALGHREIGVLYGGYVAPGLERLEGFRAGMERAGLPVREEYLICCKSSQKGGYEAAEQALRLRHRPTTLLATNNVIAMGAFQALTDYGVKMPQEMGFAGFDDFPLSAHLNPPVTVVQRATTEMGRMAAEMLLERIEREPEGGALPPRAITLATKLLVRGSCMPREDMTV